MTQVFNMPIATAFKNNGAIGVGYQLFFYAVNTNEKKDIFADENLETPLSNPVIADANGRFPQIFLAGNGEDYKAVFTTNTDTDPPTSPIWTANPVDTNQADINDFSARPFQHWGTTTGTSSAYKIDPDTGIPSYDSKLIFSVQIHTDNTLSGGNTTFEVADSENPGEYLDPVNSKKYDGAGNKVAVVVGDFQAGQRYILTMDGVDMIVLNPNYNLLINADKLVLSNQETKTISGGVIAVTKSNVLADTEGAAATDDLDTINGGVDGQKITIGNVADARNIIVKHNTGNIWNPAGFDVVLDVTSNKIEAIYSGALSKWIITSAPSLTPIMIVQDQKSSGTQGGSSSAGMNIRVLNTVVENTIPGASLAMNQVTLPAGKFKLNGSCPTYAAANGHRCYLYNVTDSANALLGTSSFNGAGIGAESFSHLNGTITIAASKVFELRHFIANGVANQGLGIESGSGSVEIYAQMLIEKIG